MSLTERLRTAAAAVARGEAAPEAVDAVLDAVRAAPHEALRVELPALLHAVAEAEHALALAREELGESLARSTQARRGLRGFGALRPVTTGQRVDRRA